jgi:hypothetical protein
MKWRQEGILSKRTQNTRRSTVNFWGLFSPLFFLKI